ncbi:conserved Plasmodium protein, unknown function [Plasmodium berghei]|uniref:Uncharacterized protein n=2 Tax=Plasmodium berghei TaxID=5821 RepID=A0A509ARK3_PLABA|nr:conserved Plasmodium protein, unknown function [Plasmodium berghei ANKA]CXI56118.1 conserved Plasmodium protein, unknown function [Plasmodium berghei]SCL95297.1 conserved Plasmodium protein, unknown function [Plasmodium berghei]SCM16223.1 conserved Plasmodium protein, unknown function [Plasmodium berghei]SCM18019.1 conserved Plasmodium protein, unknown function [Plasmodium berghei]SCN26440.1 conserved Plasmodium protein, unknown function [Plasmodium berghei]|eukprot:XP_034422147.1 conserved Plasmodium protein, unknown function [Plasmodium berghei ANKA]
MKRYVINNNTLHTSKKIRVAYEYESEIKKTGCNSPSIFDLNYIYNSIGSMKRKKINVEKLNLFNIEETVKRQKTNLFNIFNDLKNVKEIDEYDGNENSNKNNNGCNDNKRKTYNDIKGTIKKPIRRKFENINMYNSDHINKKINSRKIMDSQKKDENEENKKCNFIKNKYYEKINSLLKHMHMSKIARKNG